MEFTGFREEAFAFFRELRQNNTVAWFEENEEDFTQYIRVPFDQLLRALDEPMRELDEVFALRPVLDILRDKHPSASQMPGGAGVLKQQVPPPTEEELRIFFSSHITAQSIRTSAKATGLW